MFTVSLATAAILKIPRMAAIFKMTADKIDKISMFSDFNEN
jgi:hypothetical protein